MEGRTHLMRVIQEMQLEINKLERENKTLRGEINQLENSEIAGLDNEVKDDKNKNQSHKEEALSKGVLRRNVSVGSAQILEEQKGPTMTVRRYSMSSSFLSTSDYYNQSVNMKRTSSSGTLKLNSTMQNKGSHSGEPMLMSRDNDNQMPVRNLIVKKSGTFQEHMNKCRGKVKAVTFLLPMDIKTDNISQSTIKAPQNQNINHLTTITEKDP